MCARNPKKGLKRRGCFWSQRRRAVLQGERLPPTLRRRLSCSVLPELGSQAGKPVSLPAVEQFIGAVLSQ